MNDHLSHAHATFCVGIEQCSNRRRNLVLDEPVPDLHDTCTRNRRQTRSRFLAPVSGACVMGLRFLKKSPKTRTKQQYQSEISS